MWTANDIPRQAGRRVIVTGGASGIGFQVAKALGAKGASILIAARDRQNGERAVASLQRAVPRGDFRFGLLDLADLHSIARFADDVLERGELLDLLLNVAGVMAIPKRTLTTDGFEMHMGTNHLGHFALTGRLLPVLKAAKSARVVQVTALVARWAKLDLDDLQSEKAYAPMRAYSKSKLANILFAVELERRLRGSNLSAIAVDPGTANTSLQRHTSGFLTPIGRGVINLIGYPLNRVADPVVYGALVATPNDKEYVMPGGIIQSRHAPRMALLPTLATDSGLRERLWTRSEELTGVRYPFAARAIPTRS